MASFGGKASELIALCRLITLFGLRAARARAFQCAKLSRVHVISDWLARMPVVPEVMSTHSVRMRAERFSAIDTVDARQVPQTEGLSAIFAEDS